MTLRMLAVTTVIGLSAAAVVAQQATLDPRTVGRAPVDAWTTHHGDYSGRHFSTLNQINQSNVKSLALAWQWDANLSSQGAQIGGAVTQAVPIVLGGGAAVHRDEHRRGRVRGGGPGPGGGVLPRGP